MLTLKCIPTKTELIKHILQSMGQPMFTHLLLLLTNSQLASKTDTPAEHSAKNAILLLSGAQRFPLQDMFTKL